MLKVSLSDPLFPLYQSFQNTPYNTPFNKSLAYVAPALSINHGVEIPKYDLFLQLCNLLGFEITPYTPKKAPWGQFFRQFGEIQACTVVLSFILFFGTRIPKKSPLRFWVGILGIVGVMFFPALYGRTGLGSLDFASAGLGFLGSLHIYDIYFIRSPESIADWSFAKFHCFLFNFPAQVPKDPKHPRLQNLKHLRLCGIKMFFVYLFLYAIPPPQFAAEITNPIKWLFYNIVFSLADMWLIGGMIEGNNHVTGILWGIEMAPLMNNPVAQTNVRLFWANWNFAIQESLKSIVFAFSGTGKNKKKDEEVDLKTKVSEGLKQNIEEDKSTEKVESSVNRSSDAPKSAPSKKKSSGGFFFKALAALLTFAASGVYHEYLNHFAFGGSDGSNMIFFVSQGLGTIAYAALRKNFSKYMDHIPDWLAMTLSTWYVFVCCPYFCATFIRQGFLEDLKAVGVFGPINHFVWVFGK